jgi:hypothetical protein
VETLRSPLRYPRVWGLDVVRGSGWDMYTVRFLPFRVIRKDSNTHWATLLEDVVIQDATLVAPWTKNTNRAITTVRQVN